MIIVANETLLLPENLMSLLIHQRRFSNTDWVKMEH